MQEHATHEATRTWPESLHEEDAQARTRALGGDGTRGALECLDANRAALPQGRDRPADVCGVDAGAYPLPVAVVRSVGSGNERRATRRTARRRHRTGCSTILRFHHLLE